MSTLVSLPLSVRDTVRSIVRDLLANAGGLLNYRERADGEKYVIELSFEVHNYRRVVDKLIDMLIRKYGAKPCSIDAVKLCRDDFVIKISFSSMKFMTSDALDVLIRVYPRY